MYPMLSLYSWFVIFLSLLVAGYCTWLLFRKEQYDEQRIVDVLIVGVVSALIGARVVWVLMHLAFIERTINGIILPRSLQELSSAGALVGALCGILLFCKKFHWPYLQTFNTLAAGWLVLAWGASVVLLIENVPVVLFAWIPQLAQNVHPFIYVGYVSAILAVVVILRRYIKNIGLGAFLLAIPQVPTLLTGVVAWLIMWRYAKYGKS